MDLRYYKTLEKNKYLELGFNGWSEPRKFVHLIEIEEVWEYLLIRGISESNTIEDYIGRGQKFILLKDLLLWWNLYTSASILEFLEEYLEFRMNRSFNWN